ncbi:MAG TPA: hypothetical protein VFW39_09320, partial [Sphingomicrobium sp.]|nr:hypothetical protein [Sphingomicrobium sp.]
TVVSEEVLPLVGTERGGDTDNDGTSDVLTNSGTISLSDSISGATFTTSLTAPSGTFTSGGTAITWTLTDGGHTLTGTAGSATILVATIDDAGHYTVTLSGPIDTPNGVNSGENGGDSILNIGVTAHDNFGNTLTSGSLTVHVEDDAPTLGTIQPITTDNDPTDTNSTIHDGQGSLHLAVGADGFQSVVISPDLTNITSGGHALVGQQVGNVYTAYADIDHSGTVSSGDTAVFTITVDPNGGTTGTYTFDLLQPLDGTTQEVQIGGSTSFGAGPTPSQILNDGATNDPLSVVSGYTVASGFDVANWESTGNPGTLTLSSVNGSTAGWGVANNNFNNGEFFFFDFGSQALADPDGSGAFTPPTGTTLPDISFATFKFPFFVSGNVVDYVVHDTNGNVIGSGQVPDSAMGGTWTFTAPTGEFIGDIELYAANVGGGGGKVDLFSVGVQSTNVDVKIPVSMTFTDGDNDSVTGATTIEVSNSGSVTTTTPNALVQQNSITTQDVAHTALNTSSLMASNDNLEQQGQRVFSVGQNAALMGALAAAGLDAEHLTMDGHHLAFNLGDQLGKMPLATASIGSATPLSAGSEQALHSIQPMPVVQSLEAAQHSSPIHDMVESAHPLGSAASAQPVTMTQLLHGSTGGTGHATATNLGSMTAPAVVMPSAQQLAAATHGSPLPVNSVAGNSAQHDEVVSKVLADALHGGQGQGPNVDMLLHSLPTHAAGANGALQALATHAASFVSIEHMAMMGPYGGHQSALTVDMVMHQDAPPPAHG